MSPKTLFEWPPRCNDCGVAIQSWGEAGVSQRKWLHKACWLEAAKADGHNSGQLGSPLDAVQGGLPMILFLLLFHVGGGAAVMGWFMLTRFEYDSSGVVVFLGGLVSLFLGLGGFGLEVMFRMRAQSVRHEIERQGGWQPLEVE